MKYSFMNDKTTPIGIHAASHITEYVLLPGQSIIIEIPEGTMPFIKIWDNMVLLSYTPAETV